MDFLNARSYEAENRAGDGIDCPYYACYRRSDCEGETCEFMRGRGLSGTDRRVERYCTPEESEAARGELADAISRHGLEDVAYALGLGGAKTLKIVGGKKAMPRELAEQIEELEFSIVKKHATVDDLDEAGALFERLRVATRSDRETIGALCGVSGSVVQLALNVHGILASAGQTSLFDVDDARERAEDLVAESGCLYSSIEPALERAEELIADAV